ncbi:MAG TPA: phospholipase [Thermoanaerobaculia bacterium]|nr:phospholipase [Thermoanaerobaculia bacterium]
MPFPQTVVFVHGWSVRNTNTYGQLPERLRSEAAKLGSPIDVKHVWLGKYVSFRDEVQVADLSRGFAAAVQKELADGERFACITHSTGGPVVRDWWQRFYLDRKTACPMSHLVMLAPANFGSALAQLGKSRLSRIKTFFEGVEPGTGVLDWLELGSPESWELNRKWIEAPKNVVETSGVFPFVLTGQTIDRKLYDHVNPYTGEAGSDGVVRVAAANLNATSVRLEQELVRLEKGKPVAPRLEVKRTRTAPPTAFKIVPGRAHSGSAIGIIRSVKDDGAAHPTVEAVLRCLRVASFAEYEVLRAAFDSENAATQEVERVEIAKRVVLPDTVYFTDRYSQVIFRLQDDQGGLIGEFDLKLSATPQSQPERKPSPDLLPKGFFGDRQLNHRHTGTLTYFLNSDAMLGFPPVERDGKKRDAFDGAAKLGFLIDPHLASGLAHYLHAELEAAAKMLESVVKPNQTTLVDIVLRRVIREGVFRLVRLDQRSDTDFSKEPPGDPIPPDGTSV